MQDYCTAFAELGTKTARQPLAQTYLELYSVVKTALSRARLAQEYHTNGVVSVVAVGGHRFLSDDGLTLASFLGPAQLSVAGRAWEPAWERG